MLLTPLPTKADGDSAFHAIFGEHDGNEYTYKNANTRREAVAKSIRTARPGEAIFPSVAEGIKQLISEREVLPPAIPPNPDKFPTLRKLQDKYVPGQNFDDFSRSIIEEYANRFTEIPSIPLSPCELAIVAHVCKINIQCFSTPSTTTQFPKFVGNEADQSSVKNVYFNEKHYFQAMPVTHKASELKNTLHGNIYQLKLLMLFLYKGWEKGYAFSLATEMEAAEKFDDLVLKYKKQGDPFWTWFFLQAKHTIDQSGMISAQNLLTDATAKENPFSLQKYFISYQRIKANPAFQEDKNDLLSEMCICTNKDMVKADIEEKLGIILEKENNPEDILQLNTLGAVKYKIKRKPGEAFKNGELYQKLKQTPGQAALANALWDAIQKEGKINYTKDPFKDKEAKKWLKSNEIIITKKNVKQTDGKRKDEHQLNPDFLTRTNISIELAEFRKFYNQHGQAKDEVKDEDINDFLNHLVLAVNQPNEVDLGKIIGVALNNVFNLIDSKFIYAQFQEHVLNWMKRKEGTFLSQDDIKACFAKITQEISRFTLTGPTIVYRQKLKEVGVTFEPSVQIKDFLTKENQYQYLIYKTENVVLSSIEVSETLQTIDRYGPKNSHIFLRLKTALRLQDDFNNIFSPAEMQESKLLVLTCDSTEEEQAKTFISTLLISTFSTKKIIFIIKNSHILPEMLASDTVSVDAINSWNSLSPTSQGKIQSLPVYFQGQSQSVKLGAILPTLHNVMDTELLDELVEAIKGKKELKIGKTIDFDTIKHFERLDRTFKYGESIQEKSLKENVNDIFAVTHIEKSKLNEIIGEQNTARGFAESDEPGKTPSRYIILDTVNQSEQFRKVCTGNPTHTVHLLQKGNDKFIWKKSQGSLANLRPYLIKEEVKDQELQNRNIIIAAEPGMGKSKAISHLAYSLQSKTDTWVIKINLQEEENRLKEITFTDDQSTFNFLIKEPSALAKKIFAACLDNDKVTVHLDGFDELQLAQQEKVILLLQILKATKAKLIITTRLHLQEKLEDILGFFSHTIVPFIKEDTKEFLKELWQRALGIEPANKATFDKKADIYIPKLIESFQAAINDESRNFVGNPLHIKLLAFAFVNSFKHFYEANTDIPEAFEGITLYGLYQSFIENKYQILLKNKFGLETYNQLSYIKPAIIESLEKGHQRLAINLLFPSAEIHEKSNKVNLDLVRAAGIVQNGSYFIHRTFAEYFAAQYLVRSLTKKSEHTTHQQYKTILLRQIFKNTNNVVRRFMQDLIKTTKDLHVKSTWGEIVRSNLFFNKSRILPIPETSPLSSINTQLNWDELKSTFEKCCGYVERDKIHWTIDQAEIFCKAALNIEEIEKVTEAVKLLNAARSAAKLTKVRDKIGEYIESIYCHYIQICQDQGQPINDNLFIHRTGEIIDILKYKSESQAITPAFMQEPTKAKIRYFLLKITEPEKLLLSEQEKATLFESIKSFLKKEEAYDLLFSCSSIFSQCNLTEADIKEILSGKELEWLEREGIKMVNKFDMLTPTIANSFNEILPLYPVNFSPEIGRSYRGADGWSAVYASKVWNDLLILFLEKIKRGSGKDINITALFNMFVHFIRFSGESYYSYIMLPLVPNLINIEDILDILTNELDQQEITEEALSTYVTLLYLLGKTRLNIIDIGESLLISDRSTKFEYPLSFESKPMHKTVIKELLLTPNEIQDKEAFKEACKKAITKMRDQKELPMVPKSIPASSALVTSVPAELPRAVSSVTAPSIDTQASVFSLIPVPPEITEGNEGSAVDGSSDPMLVDSSSESKRPAPDDFKKSNAKHH